MVSITKALRRMSRELVVWQNYVKSLSRTLIVFYLFFPEVQTKKVRKVPPGLPSSVSTARQHRFCVR